MDNKGKIGIAATFALVLAIGVARAFPSGPNVNTGSNPIRYLQYADTPCTAIPGGDAPFCSSFSKKKQVFEVPVGQNLVITDFRASSVWPEAGTVKVGGNIGQACGACLLADGNGVWCSPVNPGTRKSIDASWSTGLAISSGAKVELLLINSAGPDQVGDTCAAVVTGYLMRN